MQTPKTEDAVVLRIPQWGMIWLDKKVKALNKRAAALGTPGMRVKELSTAVEHLRRPDGSLDPTRTHVVVEVELSGSPPSLEGWEFQAVVTPLSPGNNVVSKVPGIDRDIPEEYWSWPMSCDHCQNDRQRNEIFVAYNPEEDIWVAVGRSCLRDFLGHTSPEGHARYLMAYARMVAELGGAEDRGWDIFNDEFWKGCRVDMTVDLLSYLEVVACVVRHDGWLSRTRSRESGEVATADTATDVHREMWWPSTPTKRGNALLKKYKVLKEDAARAEAALEWAKTEITDRMVNQSSGFLANARALADAGQFPPKMDGFAAAIIAAYDREEQKRRDREHNYGPGEDGFVGEVGKRYDLDVTCREHKEVWTYYGKSTLHIFADEDEHILIWFQTETPRSEPFPLDTPLKVRATVKKHETFSGTDRTMLTRVVLKEPVAEAA